MIWKSFFLVASVPTWCSSTFHQFLGFGVFYCAPHPPQLFSGCLGLKVLYCVRYIMAVTYMIRFGTVYLIAILVLLVQTASYLSHYYNVNDGDTWKTIKH